MLVFPFGAKTIDSVCRAIQYRYTLANRDQRRSLPYKIFDMDQRVTHAAITDNKRLGAVLEHIKEMQDAAPPKYPVRTNSEKMGYKSNGRRPGRPSSSRTKKSIVQAAK